MTPRRDGGQATVEVALVLPILVAFAAAVVWVAVVASHQVAVIEGARAAARAASAGDDDRGALGAARRAAPGLDQDHLQLNISRTDARISVVLTYREQAPLSLLDRFVPEIALRGQEILQRESDKGVPSPANGPDG